MTRRGDDGVEMPHDPFDDSAIERLLAGDTAGGGDLAPLSSFIDDARTAAAAVPPPSPALAAALATGILPALAPAPQSLWRKSKMKLQGFLAGLGVAGKLALGAGVAAAATTGAGAAGVLPGPVQHAVASAVGAVTPFELPDGPHHDGSTIAEPGDTTTTTVEANGDDGDTTPITEHHGDVTPTPASERHDGDTTPTIEHSGDGDTTPTTEHNGDGDHESTPTTEDHNGDGENHDSTPTTEDSGGDGGDSTPTTTVQHVSFTSFTCTLHVDNSVKSVICTWSVEGAHDGDRFWLYRNSMQLTNDAHSPYTHTPEHTCVGEYYRVLAVRNGSIVGESAHASVSGCPD